MVLLGAMWCYCGNNISRERGEGPWCHWLVEWLSRKRSLRSSGPTLSSYRGWNRHPKLNDTAKGIRMDLRTILMLDYFWFLSLSRILWHEKFQTFGETADCIPHIPLLDLFKFPLLHHLVSTDFLERSWICSCSRPALTLCLVHQAIFGSRSIMYLPFLKLHKLVILTFSKLHIWKSESHFS